jgi:hypothetical protein
MPGDLRGLMAEHGKRRLALLALALVATRVHARGLDAGLQNAIYTIMARRQIHPSARGARWRAELLYLRMVFGSAPPWTAWGDGAVRVTAGGWSRPAGSAGSVMADESSPRASSIPHLFQTRNL